MERIETDNSRLFHKVMSLSFRAYRMNNLKNVNSRLLKMLIIFSTMLTCADGTGFYCFAIEEKEKTAEAVTQAPEPVKRVYPSEGTIKAVRVKPAPRPQLKSEDAAKVQPEIKVEPVPLNQENISISPIEVKPLPRLIITQPLPVSLSKDEINKYIQTLKSGQTIKEKEYAANVLGSRAVRSYMNDPIINDVYNALAGAFRENTDETLLRSAAFALGGLGREEAGAVLVNYLSYGNSNNVKYAVVSSLGRLKYRGAVNDIIRILLYENDNELKGRSAEALGLIGDRSAGYALLSVLNNNDRWIKREAIDALGNLGWPEAEYPILNILNNETDLELREAAARALQKIKNQ